jgi:aldose 1-epimerase
MTEPRHITIAHGPARARLMTRGATLTSFHLDGMAHSLLLGSADAQAYGGPLLFFGAIVGPVANRIAGARTPLGDGVLTLDANENGNALHGGANGLWARDWTVREQQPHRVTLSLTLADGEGGLPGPLTVGTTYEIEADGALRIEITGQTGRTTLCNPAFHGYWSLTGRRLAGHRLTVDADHYTPTDAALIPTGEVAPVDGTGYDLRQPVPLPGPVALDTNFCLYGEGFREVARLETDTLAMVLESDAPGLQVYDAARLDTAPANGHHGAPYGAYAGIALEPQLWPDAPNQPGFPSITLNPGERFHQTSRFRFIRKETP